jgi:hypothetical protein
MFWPNNDIESTSLFASRLLFKPKKRFAKKARRFTHCVAPLTAIVGLLSCCCRIKVIRDNYLIKKFVDYRLVRPVRMYCFAIHAYYIV